LQNAAANLNRAFRLAAFRQLIHEAAKDIDCLVPATRPFRAAPGFELLARNPDILKKFARVEVGRLPIDSGSCSGMPQLHRVNLECPNVEHNIFAIGNDDPMLSVAQSLP
jgi:hypothetical protein